jgi:hypothetical protein
MITVPGLRRHDAWTVDACRWRLGNPLFTLRSEPDLLLVMTCALLVSMSTKGTKSPSSPAFGLTDMLTALFVVDTCDLEALVSFAESVVLPLDEWNVNLSLAVLWQLGDDGQAYFRK